MTAERIPDSDWPLTVSVGPGWYGLRIDTDHGTAVHYLDASALTRNPMGQEPDEGTRPRPAMRALHDGARCEEAA